MKTREYIEQVVNTLGLDRENTSKIEQFDDRKFKFSLYLVNQDANAIKLRKGAITELYIVDDVTEWFHKGHVTVLNPEDVLERSTSVFVGDPGTDEMTRAQVNPYRFRGDCRDMLLLTFEPHIDAGEYEDSTSATLDSPVFSMKFLFTIYATEDIDNGEGRKSKMQKMYFHDYRYQLLREKNLYYSTAKNLKIAGRHDQITTPVTQLNNSARQKSTGAIIQDILKTALPEVETKDMFSYHWNFGAGNMMYTSPANYRAIDDLNYVLDRHVSSSDYGSQPCLLKLERFTERWELLPITEYFARSKTTSTIPGPYQLEYFLLSNDSEPEDVTIPPERKTFGNEFRTANVNYHFPDISVIDDYVFSEMNGVDCQELLSSIVNHRYNESTKTFSMDLAESNVLNVQSKFQEFFIDYTFGGDAGHGVTSWLSDTSRNKNFNFSVQSSWTPDKTSSLSVSRNRMLLAAFLLGNTIQFDIKGETGRQSGKWIAVDRDTNYLDNDYEKKVLGQYFVTRVTHRITSTGEYKNRVIAVKPYVYQDLSFDTEDIFETNTNVTREK